MSNISQEVVKLKNSLEKQADKLLEDARTDLIEKKFFYAREECIIPQISTSL